MKDLAYYRANAEEDYVKVPISVLRYISELENAVERMYSEEESFENKSLKWWMSLSIKEQVEIGLKYNEPTFNLTLRTIMFEFEQFKKK